MDVDEAAEAIAGLVANEEVIIQGIWVEMDQTLDAGTNLILGESVNDHHQRQLGMIAAWEVLTGLKWSQARPDSSVPWVNANSCPNC